MKKISIIITAFILAVLAASCTASEKGNGNNKNVSMYDLSKAMVQAGDLENMSYASSQDSNAESAFSRISDMDYGKVDSFFVSYASDGSVSADEIVVIAVKNSADAPEAEKSLRNHLEYRISLYNTYGASQVPKLEKGEVFTSGNYAVLIVADNPQKIHAAFTDFVSQ